MNSVRPWAIALAPAVLILGLMAWGLTAMESSTEPPTPSVETLEPGDRPDTLELAPPTPTLEPSLPQVQPIDTRPMPEWPVESMVGLGETLADSTYLGERGDYFAVGTLSEEGNVCLYLIAFDPDRGAVAECTDLPDFAHSGLILDRGGERIRWTADGIVEWPREGY